MTLLSILADGTTYPPLRTNDLIVRLEKGKIKTGKFRKYDFLDGKEYIKEPSNAKEINEDVKAFIYSEMPLFFEKRHPVFLLCPPHIQKMMEWKTAKVVDLSSTMSVAAPARQSISVGV